MTKKTNGKDTSQAGECSTTGVPDPLSRFVESPHLVSFDGSFQLSELLCKPPKDAPKKSECREALRENVEKLAALQHVLYAGDRYSVLLGFQALDAAGKDGTIKHTLSGVNPAGIKVSSFKKPSSKELDHDYLWRINKALPARGMIGVHNRTAYEEVLAVRVRPEVLEYQRIPDLPSEEWRWKQRFESIANWERHLAHNGYVIIKFFLHVSEAEQDARILDRLENPEKHYKFSPGDIDEQCHRPAYLSAYEELLRATSTRWAPWYVIPADDKHYMRMTVSDITVRTLDAMNLTYPDVDKAEQAKYDSYAAGIRKKVSS